MDDKDRERVDVTRNALQETECDVLLGLRISKATKVLQMSLKQSHFRPGQALRVPGG
jgi:hypothetical protein